MATSRELADRALELARRCAEDLVGELASLANGDRALLWEASRLVKDSRCDEPESTRAPEHTAFAVLSAAFAEALPKVQTAVEQDGSSR